MFLIISLLVITSLNTEYSCCIRVFENTDESIVTEFVCPYQQVDQCEIWFENHDGTIQECWKFDENHIRSQFSFITLEYSCHIGVFENTAEPIVMEFLCPYSDFERCEGWFNEQGGTIIECWKYDNNHVRYPMR